jgi:hypothetical protein
LALAKQNSRGFGWYGCGPEFDGFMGVRLIDPTPPLISSRIRTIAR